ncbi:hypothetical protein IMAU10141_03026 [Lactiplantibacillus plantarum]|nr:hypothetical protein [Lactiplantibacillus plantarum]
MLLITPEMPLEDQLNRFSSDLIGWAIIFSAVLKNFSNPLTFLPTQLVTPEIPLVTLFKMSPNIPVPLAKWLTPCILISMAVSLAFNTSVPAGNIILVLRP